jgi:hypothetical protein
MTFRCNCFLVKRDPMGVIDMMVPYVCLQCGVSLGRFVVVDNRVCVDFGQGPRSGQAGRCKCGRRYQFSSSHYTIEHVAEMRDNASL